jgi:hypothetical protein
MNYDGSSNRIFHERMSVMEECRKGHRRMVLCTVTEKRDAKTMQYPEEDVRRRAKTGKDFGD